MGTSANAVYHGGRPVGVGLWALTDDLVEKRIDANDKRVTAAEWKGVAIMRIIELVVPFGGEAERRDKSKFESLQ